MSQGFRFPHEDAISIGGSALPTGYLTSAIRTSPTMTSGIPRANSRTLFLTQSAALSFDTRASSALSKC